MNVIKELYEQNICPQAEILPSDPDYRILLKKAGKEREHFKGMLPEEEGVRFEEMFRLYSDIYNMELFAHFEYGFKLGGRIALEIASDDTKKVFFQ